MHILRQLDSFKYNIEYRIQKNFISYNISKVKLQDHTNIYARKLRHMLRMPFSYH